MQCQCPGCKSRFEVRDEYADMVGTCRHCGIQFVPGSVKFDPHRTIPIGRRRRWPLALAAAFLLLSFAAAWLATSERVSTPKPVALQTAPEPPPVVESETPAPQPRFSAYAQELAAVHCHPLEASLEMQREFQSIFDTAKAHYSRSTEMQIRDAIWQVYYLKAYDRPDINMLTAARMIADWAPSSAMAVSRTDATMSGPGGTSRVQGSSQSFLAVSDVPVSRAAKDIADGIVGAYNKRIAAQWEAYYAQQEELYRRQIAREEREAAVRKAQAEAAAQIEAARIQAQMQHQQWLQNNSVYGQFWRQRR